MAVLLELRVRTARREQFDELDDRVGEAMDRAGGPPAGLLAHVVSPEGDGFVIADVWRTEAEGRGFLADVLVPLIEDLGLTTGETTARPVWSFARP